jgi:HB1/ASXL restriction endonuclease-like protein with HTH domain
MSELKWKEAIIKVLKEEKKALHYTEIAEMIAEKGYRTSLGATPQDTVSANLTTDINKNKEKSIFARVDRGFYILRKFLDESSNLIAEEFQDSKAKKRKDSSDKLKVINSFGIYWNRDFVHWKSTPDLLGIQQVGATNVNFRNQIGIYLLHDSRETIYVGQAIEQPLGQRLKNHTTDRLGGRWDRFSWFGFYPITENGELDENLDLSNMSIKDFGDILEAILIESIEPRQNRKQGNQFSGIEFLQKEAPEIKKRMKEQIIRELTEKL